MSAYDVAMAMKNQDLCSSSISGKMCVSSDLMSEHEWKGVEAMKHSLIYWGKDNLCSTECAEDECGPVYIYITQFNVIPGEDQSKKDFANVRWGTFSFSAAHCQKFIKIEFQLDKIIVGFSPYLKK